ncbi:MAG: glycosyltransferase [Lachnospiraceae bacterium]|nr:glycosyltransferase [Lachnospiraceae bacterium]
MILQHIVWPDEARPETTELYYHADIPVQYTKEGVYFLSPGELRFDTYFNFFDARKWRRYTGLREVRFRIRLNGAGSVRLMGMANTPVAEQEFSGRQEISFTLSGQMQDYYYLSLSLQKPAVIEAGTVETEAAGNDVKLALVICTYNRPKELLRNIALLKERNQEAVDGTRVLNCIYIVDNARNLQKEVVEGPEIFLIPNKNTGGAGGFTRGMQEAMKREDITHILLMDDDVIIEFEAFARTKSLLQLIDKKYESNFIGGAMFRIDVPYILHAAGEGWENNNVPWTKMRIINPYMNTDMRTMQQVIQTSRELKLEHPHAAWWYCCIPRGYIKKSGYPLPLFLHFDDVEYGLRNGKTPLCLNGIAVWHEEFEDKKSSVMEYYDTRNRLITNAIYKQEWSILDAFYILCERFYATVFRYRYKDFALSVKAVEDFLKGPEWLNQVDAEALHESLKEYGYIMREMDEKPLLEYRQKNRIATVARYFIPAFSTATIRMGAPVSAYAGKKRVLLVEPKAGKGFVVEKSWRETVRCVGKMISCMRRLGFRYEKVRKRWRSRGEEKKCSG